MEGWEDAEEGAICNVAATNTGVLRKDVADVVVGDPSGERGEMERWRRDQEAVAGDFTTMPMMDTTDGRIESGFVVDGRSKGK